MQAQGFPSRINWAQTNRQLIFWEWQLGSGGFDHHLRYRQPYIYIMANIDATKAKSTVFIGGLAQTVDEAVLVETFSPFGDVMEVQIPPSAAEGDRPAQGVSRHFPIQCT